MPTINDPVFAPRVPQSVRLLSGLVHDTSLPYKVRQGAARLLIPHLQAELARLGEERGLCPDRNAARA